jgi:hypothetical protein
MCNACLLYLICVPYFIHSSYYPNIPDVIAAVFIIDDLDYQNIFKTQLENYIKFTCKVKLDSSHIESVEGADGFRSMKFIELDNI